ncbi:hypothetical protein JHN61_18985 [Streptomyces sp. MBT67]|uniref:hypothetical protein n=1 Tax=unclassified Streptomyces TaxID=2593676 RepID=UPI00190C2A37|nr:MULTISPECIES: hypothetical protein [unclassified Streptomyces]MBK3532576.1 hypothetical protein [Streptomyces sp. MBT72]MBK3538279.1 hypothetical protein [Streptomyces sp. MBT67]MBK3551295.1 hypothetical protein [Streptomyces sp. MBT61]MBK6030666.1 hypothetical protein [Streptomyces sp. MBT59]
MRISSSVRPRSARTGAKAAVAVAIAGASLAGAPAAYAAPGDSGNIDVRSVSWHSNRDGVEVCKFVLSASNFESFPSVPWTITEQPPTVPPGTTLMDRLPLINGSARSEAYLLPEGTYQLVWVVPAGPKQRSFKVECDRGSNHGSKPHKPQQPIGGVPAGGGGVPDMEPVSSESDSNATTTGAWLAAGAAGAAGLIMMRRSARRRARGEA